MSLKLFALLALFVAVSVTASGDDAKQKNTAGEEPKLAEQLEATAAAAAKRFPPEMMNKFKAATEAVKSSGLERSAKQVGDQAIDARLTDWNGDSMTLSEQWAKGPVVLMWYRGGW